MQMYSLSKGREGLLIRPNGDVEPYVATKGHAFTNEDIAMDPIRLHNIQYHGGQVERTTQFQHIAEKLAKQGYTVFQMPGRGSGYIWGFAVIIGEMDTELD